MIDPNPRPVQITAFWARRAWLAILAVAGALEVYGVWVRKGPDDTLSETTRYLFRTNTRTGLRLWYGFWPAFAVWFLFHIGKKIKQQDPGTRHARQG